MTCSNCGNNMARIYTRITDGREMKLQLCTDCYAELYEGDEPTLLSLFSREGGDAVCPDCGTTMQDYRETGLVGCANCYRALRQQLLPNIMRIQGTGAHTGERPAMADEATYDRMRKLLADRQEVMSELHDAEEAQDSARAEEIKAQLKRLDRLLARGEA